MTETPDLPEPILHPWTLSAIAILIVNDQYLKYAYTSWLTGKLSDVAGLIFFPILLEPLLKSRSLAVWFTGVGFTMVKLTVIGNEWYNMLYQQFFDLVGVGRMMPLVMDATDCWALVFLCIPLWWIPKQESMK